MSYILVTGSEGLLGKQMCLSLEISGRKVQRFDIKFPKNHENFGNILNKNRLREKMEQCVGIIHLAAVSRVIWGEKDPELCWQTNVIGTQNIIHTAKDSPLKPWIVYASSREVYGQQKNLPVEIDAECMPLNIYARSKLAAEKDVLKAREFKVKTAIIRYSSVYGSVYDHKDRVVPAFCRAAVLGKLLNVEGFANTLDFTHVEDTVKGTIAVIKILESDTCVLPPIHLTTGVPTTLGDLAKLACKSANKELELIGAPIRTYDVARFYGNTIKTEQLIGWRSEIPLATGIHNLTQQFKALLEGIKCEY